MITDPVLKWAATVAFVVTAVFWAVRAGARSATIPSRVTGVLHVVMSLAMLAMVWPRLPSVSTVAGMTVFAIASAIFLVLLATRHDHGIDNGYHALMVATMVWMYAVMDPSMVGGTHTSSGGGSMDMGGGTTMSMPTTMTMRLPSWAGYLDLAIGLVYVTTATVWVAYTYQGALADDDHARRRTGAMQAVMAAAMAVMFLSYTG
ncbi:DUF5134 domain-containing protein [Nocardia vinacea]|uniref:DUF5134 domain-containing protein n=1 Tax=Nocardia vinacea TaxID=96468 RepID=A0ABZ1YT19_9NOCA|nr:DUF5134 domain-containing protein [Nocardia vinacea]